MGAANDPSPVEHAIQEFEKPMSEAATELSLVDPIRTSLTTGTKTGPSKAGRSAVAKLRALKISHEVAVYEGPTNRNEYFAAL